MNYIIFGNDPRFDYLDQLLCKSGFVKAIPANVMILSHNEDIDSHKSCLRNGGLVFGGKGYSYSHKYKSINSMLTAEGALCLVISSTSFSVNKSSLLLLGYGYLGKAVAALFRRVGANVTVASDSEDELFLAASHGFPVCTLKSLNNLCYDIIINTVPACVLTDSMFASKKGILFELASVPCTTKDFSVIPIIKGNALPGRFSPYSAAANIYEEIMEQIEKDII